MGTVRVEYYDCDCPACGWMHRIMVGDNQGRVDAEIKARDTHARATNGTCVAAVRVWKAGH